MARRGLTSFHLFVLAVAATTVLALLPLRFIGWINDVASIARLPAMPFSDLSMRVRHWLGGDVVREGAPPDDLEHLQTELDRYRAMANRWRSEAEKLASINAQLQRTQARGLDVQFAPVVADIIGRNTQSDGDTYELNVGSHRHSIREGAVAVYEGVHLIGTIGAAARLSSTMVPITDPVFDLLRGEVEPSNGDPDERVTVHLNNLENGTFEGQAPSDAGIAVGDFVYLNDHGWPRTAQSMILGTVRSIEPDPDTPVLVDLIVQPMYSPRRLRAVTVKVETPMADEVMME